MPIFDFHCHPSMKPQFSPAGREDNPWEDITVELNILNDIKLKISPWFADSLDSQSSLSQLHKGKVNLIGLILYSPESMIAKGLLSKSIVANGHIPKIDAAKLNNIVGGDAYFTSIQNEIQHLLNKAKAPTKLGLPSGTKFKLIQSINEYDKNDLNTIHGFLIIEGLHGLMNNPLSPNVEQEFFDNLNTITTNHRIFAANITHLQDMPLANHASGMQFLNDEDFYPTGNGITPFGESVIKELYNRNILIDIKHMGLWSRMNLYALRSNENIALPLICTHAGVTGISMNDRLKYLYEQPKDLQNVWGVKYYKKWGSVPHAVFNMNSINLYDEDIVQILGSGGLIGISLDQRIVGFPADNIIYALDGFPYDEEYISMQEKVPFFGANRNPLNFPLFGADENEVISGDDVRDQEDRGLDEIHAYYFWNQIIHILTVAKQNVNKGLSVVAAAKQICLGSDFDGLINPVDCCENVTQYSSFKSQLKRISETKGFWTNTVFSKTDIDVNKLLNDLFFNNAEAFLKLHFV
jgi:microsomal dipeptidase-like Zn-dependent dipeptidase